MTSSEPDNSETDPPTPPAAASSNGSGDASGASTAAAAPTDDPSSRAAISIRGLSKVFGADELEAKGIEMARSGYSKEQIQSETGAVLAVKDVSLDIAPGELFVVMGLSGCGKSTLVRLINRLIECSEGEVWLGDAEVTAADAQALREIRRHRVAMVFQEYGLLPHRTVAGNVGFGLELMGVEPAVRNARVAETLETVELSAWSDRLADDLSGGMRQRVGLARALANDTPILLMDEPFSALDPLIRSGLQDELLHLQERFRKTIVFITHDLSEAVKMGDRVAIMRDGEIVQVGTPKEIVLQPADDYVAEFISDVRQNSLISAGSVMGEIEHSLNHNVVARAAHALFVEHDWNYALVVDDQMRYIGTLTLQTIDREWSTADQRTVGQLPLRNETTVSPETVLDEVVPVGMLAQHPIPVCADDGLLVGEVQLEVLARAIEDG